MTAREKRAAQLAAAERLTMNAGLALRRGDLAAANGYLARAITIVQQTSNPNPTTTEAP
jgi:hypothetical protein